MLIGYGAETAKYPLEVLFSWGCPWSPNPQAGEPVRRFSVGVSIGSSVTMSCQKELAKRLIGVLCDLALPIHPLSMIFYMAPRVFSKFINHPMVSLLLTYNFP